MAINKPRKKAPEPIANALKPILDSFDADGQFDLVRLVRAWPEIVGETIARRTEVCSLKFHAAVVKVSTAMWIQELNLLKGEILARIQAQLGADAVRELRFVKGALSRRERSRLRPAPRSPRRLFKLPEIKDPELRSAFEGLIEAWGRSSR